MTTQTIEVKISQDTINRFANGVADEIANRLYYEFLMVRFLPEIEAIESGKIKAWGGSEAKNYLKNKIVLLK